MSTKKSTTKSARGSGSAPTLVPSSPKARISRRGLRAKGLGFEREVAAFFRMTGFIKAERHLEFQTSKAKGIDLDSTGPFRVQCKSFRKYPSISRIKEIQDASGIPLLVVKANGERPMVALPMEDFMRMTEAWLRSMSKEKQAEHEWADPHEMDLGF